MNVEIGSLYKWNGPPEDEPDEIPYAHYLVLEKVDSVTWLCLELESGRRSETTFHDSNQHNWEQMA